MHELSKRPRPRLGSHLMHFVLVFFASFFFFIHNINGAIKRCSACALEILYAALRAKAQCCVFVPGLSCGANLIQFYFGGVGWGEGTKLKKGRAGEGSKPCAAFPDPLRVRIYVTRSELDLQQTMLLCRHICHMVTCCMFMKLLEKSPQCHRRSAFSTPSKVLP